MGLGMDTETELFLMLDLSMDEEKECEHSQHRINQHVHHGEAKWYLSLQCPGCGNEKGVRAVCDGWKNYIFSPVGSVYCASSCFKEFPSVYWIIKVCERIGK